MQCELCNRDEHDIDCQMAKTSDVTVWSRETLKAIQDLLLCLSCVEDIKVVGLCLNKWDRKITIDASWFGSLPRQDSSMEFSTLRIKEEPDLNYSPHEPIPFPDERERLTDVSPKKKTGRKKLGRGRPKKCKNDQIPDSKKESPPKIEIEDANRLATHEILHHQSDGPQRKFSCRTCQKTFSMKQYLERHELTHSPTKPFKCEKCGKSFKFKALLQDHNRIHSGEKPFKCEKCGAAFTHRTSLKFHHSSKHDESYLKERPFQCETCGMGFRQKTHLVDHRRVHSGEKPYSCQYCGKRFSRVNSKTKHERTHTGERPFKCEHCEKAFASSSHLSSHVRTHTGEKPHRCDECGKSFRRKDNLREHERIHSGELPFQCVGCGIKFNRKKLLMDHLDSCRSQPTLPTSSLAESAQFMQHQQPPQPSELPPTPQTMPLSISSFPQETKIILTSGIEVTEGALCDSLSRGEVFVQVANFSSIL